MNEPDDKAHIAADHADEQFWKDRARSRRKRAWWFGATAVLLLIVFGTVLATARLGARAGGGPPAAAPGQVWIILGTLAAVVSAAASVVSAISSVSANRMAARSAGLLPAKSSARRRPKAKP